MAELIASPSTIVLTGATGLLGSEFRERLGMSDERCLTRSLLDVRHYSAIFDRIARLQPSLLINCAADTDVEAAENNPALAFSSNAILPGLLGQFCHAKGITLVHFSSTGCYGIGRTSPYTDFDPLQPTTIHHRSKAAGEDAVRDSRCAHLILRLGWVYGGGSGHRKNFVWNRIREGRSNIEMYSDPYQSGNPTWSGDIVAQTLKLLTTGLVGTFNCVSTGSATRFDYVQAVVERAGVHTRLRPRRFERLAPVSPNETAVNTKLDLLGLNNMPNWDDALFRYIDSLLQVDKN